MGPDPPHHDVPSRPKFFFDLKNPPWTDGRGSQESYHRNVMQWKAMHDLLPDNHSARLTAQLQGTILKSQLFGRAADLAEKVTTEQLQSENGAMYIAKTIYKVDALSALTDGFPKFQTLLGTRRGASESFSNFESRFDAAVCKFNATATEDKLSPSLIAFMLLANSNVENNHRVSILAAAAPQEAQNDQNSATDLEIPKFSLSYETIATVIRSCDRTQQQRNSPSSIAVPTFAPLSSHSARASRSFARKRLSQDEIKEMKRNTKCKACDEVGHWRNDPECKKSHKGRRAAPSSDRKQGTVTFHMAQVMRPEEVFENGAPGPMVDDAAPYSGMGLTELQSLASLIMPGWNGELQPLPRSIANRPWWQYGNGSHASPARRILGSVYLSVRSSSAVTFRLRHLVVEGSTQLVIGRNFTTNVNIMNASGGYVSCPMPDGSFEMLPLETFDMHSYVCKERFYHEDFRSVSDPTCLAICAAATPTKASWKTLRSLIDKVHRHVCGHSNFGDMKLLLERNGLWTEECAEYLANIIDSCEPCHAVRQPQKPRTVSLNSLNRDFNEVVFVDHLFPDDLIVFHVMDSKTRYSTGVVVSSTSMEEAIAALDSCWLGPLWAPVCLQADKAFENVAFQEYLQSLGTKLRPSPPYRHNKNALESKHRVIRDVFLRLPHADANRDPCIHAIQSLRICNDLYGNDFASAYELAHNRTRPVMPGHMKQLSSDIIEAHDHLVAVRKLNAILRSKATVDKHVKVGDVAQVYRKASHGRRGSWSRPTPVLEYNPQHQSVSVTSSSGRNVTAALEDTRRPVSNEIDLAVLVQQAVDEYSPEVDGDFSSDAEFGSRSHILNTPDSDDEGFGCAGTSAATITDIVNLAESPDPAANNALVDDHAGVRSLPDEAAVTYIPAQESTFDPEEPIVEQSAVRFTDHARIGQRELNALAPADINEPQMRTRSHSVHDIELKPGQDLPSNEQSNLKLYKDRFNSKEFLKHQSQGLPASVTENAYAAEEQRFLQSCDRVHASRAPPNANVISSHVLYKIKDLDDNSLHCKARIAPHGNNDKDRVHLRTDSASCPASGMRLLLSLCVLLGWFLTKIDVKSAFLQSGPAARDVYVIPPRECHNRHFLWLLLVAAYGLANANAKWQNHSDETFTNFGLRCVPLIPQLFFKREEGQLVLIVAKVVDDILVAGTHKARGQFQAYLETIYELGTVTHMPGEFRFLGLQLTQNESMKLTISADEKLTAIQPATISRICRKASEDHPNSLEKHVYQSVNGSLGFLGQNVSPFASFYTSFLQQRNGNLTVSDLVQQINIVKRIKTISMLSRFRRPPASTYEISLLTFSDAARPSDHGQLGYLAGVLIGDLRKGSVFHPICWRSHLSARPTKSSASAETLAAGDAIDDGILLTQSLELILNSRVNLSVGIDSKDLYTSLSTCRTPTDKSIRGDVSLIRYNFETRRIHRVIWLPGTVNPADVLTKINSGLTEIVELLLYDGILPRNLTKAECRDATRSLG